MLCAKIDIFHSVSAILDRFLQKRSKGLAQRRKVDPVLWTLRAGDTRLHVREIQFKIDAVIDLAFAWYAKHFLRAKIIFERGALPVASTCRAQICNRFLVNGEESHRCAILRRHVPNRRAVRHRQRCCAATVKFDEFSDDFLRAQHLRDVQHEVGRGHAFAQLPGEMNPDNFRR